MLKPLLTCIQKFLLKPQFLPDPYSSLISQFTQNTDFLFFFVTTLLSPVGLMYNHVVTVALVTVFFFLANILLNQTENFGID